MAMLKFGHASVSTPVVCPGKWIDRMTPKGRIVIAKDVIAKYDPSKWLLSHVTIMASVDVDLANPSNPKSNYLIKPEYSIFVNNNGDSWERKLLKLASQSFVGADNFVEHVQIPELSKGKVIDLALRDVAFSKDKEGKDLDTLYVDILIATNKRHTDLIEKIQSGEYNAVSMGCLIKYSQCSQCGRIAEDESQACKHVRYFKNNFFYDKNGIKRIVAELCGRSEDPDSCKFMDASWVRKPAFGGAVKNKILELNDDLSEKLMKAVSFPSFEYQPGMYLKAASQSAIDIVNEVEAQEGEDPKPPADDVGFPEAPPESKKPLETETPSEDAPLGEGATPDTDSLGDLGAPGAPPGGGTAPTPEPQIEEPKEDATVQEVKDLVKNQILNEIRREILKEQATESTSEERPTSLENSTNESLVKDASYRRIFASAKKLKNDRLYNGLMILSNLKNWNQFKRYGYNRSDVLGILHFVDKNISAAPVGVDAVRTLSKVKLGSDGLIPFFTKMIVEIGRRPSSIESKKIASWAKILRNF